jgi:lipoprotein-anchoring transpeptidase ErfK/SrfK
MMRFWRIFAAILMLLPLSQGPAAEAGMESQRSSFWLWSKRALPKPYRGREVISYRTAESPGTLIVETKSYSLYFVLPGGKAIRYPVGVGRQGFAWSGTAYVAQRAEWPAWYPPQEMVERAAAQGQFVPYRIDGGKLNPLGARALYLHERGRDTLYRIHGTNEPRSIGRNVSSGCIRLLNEDVIDLYDRVALGAKVIVR